MRLAAAVGADEHQPAARILGKGARQAHGAAQVLSLIDAQLAGPQPEILERLIAVQRERAQLRAAASGAGLAKVGREDLVYLAQVGIDQARGDARVEILQPLIRRDHRRQPIVVAVVEDLEELLLRPRGAVVCAQIVQDQQRRVADGVEPLVEARRAVRRVGRPQMIEQVGHDHEEHRVAQRDAEIGDGGGQVRLAAAVAAHAAPATPSAPARMPGSARTPPAG